MKKLILLLFTLTISHSVFSQCNGRYQTEIFSSVTKTTVNYSDVYTNVQHEMDIYTPDGDTEINRPLILFMHGGSFTGGSKELIDCVDFCESFAKRGYVTASVNYRLASNPINFMLDQELQYRTVFKSIADIKSAIRYFRKDYNNGNTYSIDDNTIFIGGSSAGGVIAVNLAYVDDISDLPTSPIDVQSIANSLGGLEGDAGNDGYSSQVSGVISFAGGINDVNWIDNLDEPLVSIQGDLDETRMGCPIFTYNDILQEAGIILTDDLPKYKDEDTKELEESKDLLSTLSLGELKKQMKEAINDENYERASELRDEINKRKEK